LLNATTARDYPDEETASIIADFQPRGRGASAIEAQKNTFDS